MEDKDGKYILKGVLQTFNQTSGGRIYDKEVYYKIIEEYNNKKTIEQREENINALIEDREVKNITPSIPVSWGHDSGGNLKKIEIVDDKLMVDIEYQPESVVQHLDLDIHIHPASLISSRGFTSSNDIS